MLIKIKIQRCLQVLVDYKYKNKFIYLIIMENYIINTILTIFFIGFILCRYFYAKWFIDNNLYPHANLIRDNRLKKK
jgi:hypothetical protein